MFLFVLKILAGTNIRVKKMLSKSFFGSTICRRFTKQVKKSKASHKEKQLCNNKNLLRYWAENILNCKLFVLGLIV